MLAGRSKWAICSFFLLRKKPPGPGKTHLQRLRTPLPLRSFLAHMMLRPITYLVPAYLCSFVESTATIYPSIWLFLPHVDFHWASALIASPHLQIPSGGFVCELHKRVLVSGVNNSYAYLMCFRSDWAWAHDVLLSLSVPIGFSRIMFRT